MRSYTISDVSIERLLSMSADGQKKQIREMQAEKTADIQKQPSDFSFSSLDFNANTRMAKVVFTETEHFRTIDRYFTRNYIRTPLYSCWKTKNKEKTVSIKLTNKELENLNCNENDLIRIFSINIVASLPGESFYPSWFLLRCIENDRDFVFKEAEKECKNFRLDIISLEAQIRQAQIKADYIKEERTPTLNRLNRKRNKFQQKLDKQHKKSVLLNIITLLIYYYISSDKRYNSLNKKLDMTNSKIKQIKTPIDDEYNNILRLENELSQKKLNFEEYKQKFEISTKEAENTFENKKKEITSLPITNDDCDFLPLKDFKGLEKKIILGCYIIKNNENQRVYIGQSKDVFRRLNDHFNGTVPKNHIFAEDYYKSNFENKEDLFSVKIIKCETKDELDSKERELIEEYDAFNLGYNGTNGNR